MASTQLTGVKVFQFDPWRIVEVLWLLLTGVLAWIGQRAIKRLDQLESEAVRKIDFEKAISEIHAERLRLHGENQEILKRIESKIDVGAQATMQEKLRNLETKLERLAAYTEGMKHQYLDPYLRATDVLRVEVDRLKEETDG